MKYMYVFRIIITIHNDDFPKLILLKKQKPIEIQIKEENRIGSDTHYAKKQEQ